MGAKFASSVILCSFILAAKGEEAEKQKKSSE
jgi:hypothetical protein